MQFIIKDENYPEVVMSSEFSDLDKSLLVEIIRKRLHPSKVVIDTSYEANIGEMSVCCFKSFYKDPFCKQEPLWRLTCAHFWSQLATIFAI